MAKKLPTPPNQSPPLYGDSAPPSSDPLAVTPPPERMSSEIYFRERDVLLKLEQANTEQHDKAILTLTAGALGLTLTFLEKIAPNPIPWTYKILGYGWVALIGSMTAMVASFFTGQSACRRQLEILNNEYRTGQPSAENNAYSLATLRLNGASFCLFLVGITLILVFSWTNLRPMPLASPVSPIQPASTGPEPAMRTASQLPNPAPGQPAPDTGHVPPASPPPSQPTPVPPDKK